MVAGDDGAGSRSAAQAPLPGTSEGGGLRVARGGYHGWLVAVRVDRELRLFRGECRAMTSPVCRWESEWLPVEADALEALTTHLQGHMGTEFADCV
jgi:hypothetical protein